MLTICYIDDLAKRYGVTRHYIHKLILEGRLPYPSNHKEHSAYKRYWFLHNIEKYDHLAFEAIEAEEAATNQNKQAIGF